MPKVLPLRDAYRFAIQNGLEAEVDDIQDLEMNSRVINAKLQRTVRKGHIVSLLQDKRLWEQFVQNHWPTGSTPWGEQRTKHYLLWKSRNEDFEYEESDQLVEKDGLEGDAEQRFEFEKQLRDFLQNNLYTIEQGLKLYEDAGRNGVEFHVDNGFIDILAIDKNGRFVVIELKLSTGRNKAIGQLLYYMGWVDANLGHAPCRGLIIAREISQDLVLAVQRVPGVSLFRYKISLSLQKV